MSDVLNCQSSVFVSNEPKKHTSGLLFVDAAVGNTHAYSILQLECEAMKGEN